MTSKMPRNREFRCGKCRLGIPHTDADHADPLPTAPLPVVPGVAGAFAEHLGDVEQPGAAEWAAYLDAIGHDQ